MSSLDDFLNSLRSMDDIDSGFTIPPEQSHLRQINSNVMDVDLKHQRIATPSPYPKPEVTLAEEDRKKALKPSCQDLSLKELLASYYQTIKDDIYNQPHYFVSAGQYSALRAGGWHLTPIQNHSTLNRDMRRKKSMLPETNSFVSPAARRRFETLGIKMEFLFASNIKKEINFCDVTAV
jgi:hypothetical protein